MLNARLQARPARQVEAAHITDLSHDGRGVARVDGKTVFVDDALPGEEVAWVRLKRSRNFDEGRLERVLAASPDRVAPRCAHFGTCGGCALQHLAPARQLEFKQGQLSDALSRIGRVAPAQLLPPLQAGVWNYRRRARLAARWVPKKGRTVVGFRERHAPYVADVKHCDVLGPPMDTLVEPLSLLFSGLSIRNRIPQVEAAIGDNAVGLVIRVLEPPSEADCEQLRQFERVHGVRIYLQPGGYETVARLGACAGAQDGAGTQSCAAEPAELEYRLPRFDLSLRFLPTDFVQVNGQLNARMVERAVELLAPRPGERVLDLFCGIGNFSLPLARSGARVTGVEGEAGLVARARANAQHNDLPNAEFFTADLAADDAGEAAWAARTYDKVLLDPPRAGAKGVLPTIARSGARSVLYVSCHPGTLARDAGILVHEHGFTLQAAGVMDMFPHTAHVESAALFARSG